MTELMDLYQKQTRNGLNDNNNIESLSGYYTLVDESSKQNPKPETPTRSKYQEQFRKKRNSNSLHASFNNGERKPVSFSASSELRLPPIKPKTADREEPNQYLDIDDDRPDSIISDQSIQLAKKIVKFNFWWDNQESNIRLPQSYIPDYKKKVNSKVGSLDNYSHRPGGGNIRILNDKLQWRKEKRTDHFNQDYQKNGGDIRILDLKTTYKANSKVGSLENARHRPGGGDIQILDQPVKNLGVKPRIDTGFIYEEVLVPAEYKPKLVVRKNQQVIPERSARSPYTDVRKHTFRDLN